MSGSDKKRRIVPTRAPKRKHSDEEEPIPERVKIPKGETVEDRREFYKQVDAMVSLHSTFFTVPNTCYFRATFVLKA